MGTKSETDQIIARYSPLKVGGWVVLVVSASVWVLVDGASRGWQVPAGRYGWLFPGAVVSSVFMIMISAVLVMNFASTRGVAIAKVGDEFVLNFPLSRRRVAASAVTVSATLHDVATAALGANLFKALPVKVQQVTIRCSAGPEWNFRTGLLRESASTIAERMTALAK